MLILKIAFVFITQHFNPQRVSKVLKKLYNHSKLHSRSESKRPIFYTQTNKLKTLVWSLFTNVFRHTHKVKCIKTNDKLVLFIQFVWILIIVF